MRRIPILLAVTLISACGGDTGPSGGGNADGHMTAKINGQAFASDPAYVNLGVTVQAVAPGLYVIAGAHVNGSNSQDITISVYNVRGPGTYPIGVGATVVGGSGIVAENGGGWGTDLSGNAGSITITTLTATRIKGTFNFTAKAVTGGATGTRTVSDGDFDLKVNSGGSLPVVPDQNGSSASGTIGGNAWNASTVAGLISGATFLVNAGNTAYSTTITITNFGGAGTYPLETGTQARTVAVSGPSTDPQGSNCCWGAGAGMSGNITISSVTSTRIKGSFDVTLVPTPGTGAVGNITATGSFDLGLPQLP